MDNSIVAIPHKLLEFEHRSRNRRFRRFRREMISQEDDLLEIESKIREIEELE